MATDAAGGVLGGEAGVPWNDLRRRALDDPHDLADLGAGGGGVLLGARAGVLDRRRAGLAEHRLGIVVARTRCRRASAPRRRSPASAVDHARRRPSMSRIVTLTFDRRLVAGDLRPSLSYVRVQVQAGRLDVLLGDAEARQRVDERPATWCSTVSSASTAVGAVACTPASSVAMSGTTFTVPWPVTVIERVAVSSPPVARRRWCPAGRWRRPGSVAPFGQGDHRHGRDGGRRRRGNERDLPA